MENIPVEILRLIAVKADPTVMCCVNREIRKNVAEVRPAYSKAHKVSTVIRDVMFRPRRYFSGLREINVLFSDGQGRVLCWLERKGSKDHPVYKLDGCDTTPSFTLDKDQEHMFFRLLEREMPRIRCIDVYGPLASAPVKTLGRRLRSAMGDPKSVLMFPRLI